MHEVEESMKAVDNEANERNFAFGGADEMQQLKDRILDNRCGCAEIWRGAEVIVTVDPIPGHNDSFPNDIVVVTGSKPLAIKLSWLLACLRDILESYIDFGNKYYFYGTLARTAQASIKKSADEQTCLIAVWEEAEAFRREWRQAAIEDQIMRKRNAPESLLMPEDDSPFKAKPSLDHILRYLASFEIQFSDKHYGDPQQSMEIVMEHKASTALPVLEAYCNLNDIPFTRPAGPVRMIALPEAIRLEKLLKLYRESDWVTNIPVSSELLIEAERTHSLRNITDYDVIGRTNAGYKMEIQFRGQRNVNWPRVKLDKGQVLFFACRRLSFRHGPSRQDRVSGRPEIG